MLSDLIDEIPDSNTLLHFDGHPRNVLMYGADDNRNLMLTDVGDMGIGHPLLEIAGVCFLMLEPDYAETDPVSAKITGMPRELQREFCRRYIAELFHVTDDKELDHLFQQASLIARLKSAFVGLSWATIVKNPERHRFLERLIPETVRLAPEIKAAIHTFVKLMAQ